jgi:hypothetical protein
MTVVKISELRPVGSELFQDSESYLNALNDQQTSSLVGGHSELDDGVKNALKNYNAFSRNCLSTPFFRQQLPTSARR